MDGRHLLAQAMKSAIFYLERAFFGAHRLRILGWLRALIPDIP
jgi:hypothetical protein